MKGELNNYKINNPDGINKEKYSDCKISYNNDKLSYIFNHQI